LVDVPEADIVPVAVAVIVPVIVAVMDAAGTYM